MSILLSIVDPVTGITVQTHYGDAYFGQRIKLGDKLYNDMEEGILEGETDNGNMHIIVIKNGTVVAVVGDLTFESKWFTEASLSYMFNIKDRCEAIDDKWIEHCNKYFEPPWYIKLWYRIKMMCKRKTNFSSFCKPISRKVYSDLKKEDFIKTKEIK